MGTIKRTFANNLTGAGKFDATQLDSNIPAANIANSSVTNVSSLPSSLGQAIASVAGNPPSQSLGDVWYNSNTGKLKVYGLNPGSWASGGNANTPRRSLNGAGLQTAAVVFGGYSPSLNDRTAATEEYDGSSWTSSGSMATKRQTPSGAGTQTAALGSGGYYEPPATTYTNTEEYNGTSWTAGGSLNLGVNGQAALGTQTSALGFGGYRPINNPPSGYKSNTEEYDGSTWTTSNALNTAASGKAGAGTQTAGLAFGGSTGSVVASTESYDGTTWTNLGGSLSTGRASLGGCGTQSIAFAFGGDILPGASNSTESWDGSSWSSQPNMTTARSGFGPAGDTTSALVGLGHTGGGVAVTTTEEFTGPAGGIKSVTTS